MATTLREYLDKTGVLALWNQVKTWGAPKNHASGDDTYGKGTSSTYGHVKLSDSTTGTGAAASSGVAASEKAVADALQAAKNYADSQAGEANVQSDWNQTNTSADDFIKNKPIKYVANKGAVPATPGLYTDGVTIYRVHQDVSYGMILTYENWERNPSNSVTKNDYPHVGTYTDYWDAEDDEWRDIDIIGTEPLVITEGELNTLVHDGYYFVEGSDGGGRYPLVVGTDSQGNTTQVRLDTLQYRTKSSSASTFSGGFENVIISDIATIRTNAANGAAAYTEWSRMPTFSKVPFQVNGDVSSDTVLNLSGPYYDLGDTDGVAIVADGNPTRKITGVVSSQGDYNHAGDESLATIGAVKAMDSDTKNTAGSTADAAKLYIIGAKSQATNPQTYSQANAYITAGKVYSNNIETVNLSDTQALTNKTINGYTPAAAMAKSVDTSISDGSSSANLPTTAAVASYVATAIQNAQMGAAMFQGTAGTGANDAVQPDDSTASGATKFSALTDYKKGQYWVVTTAGTYVGETCEVGDFIFCTADKSSSYSASNFSVVQSNMNVAPIEGTWIVANCV